jgi:hypothetical protein
MAGRTSRVHVSHRAVSREVAIAIDVDPDPAARLLPEDRDLDRGLDEPWAGTNGVDEAVRPEPVPAAARDPVATSLVLELVAPDLCPWAAMN